MVKPNLERLASAVLLLAGLRHKASGQAVVTLNGQDVYLGPHGTRTSKAAYDRKIAEWLANERQPFVTTGHSLTILEAIARYWRHVRGYYRKNGRPTGEQAGIRSALRVLRKLYEE